MNSEPLLRWFFGAVLIGFFLISGYFRRRARQIGGVIPRVKEGRLILAIRVVIAAPLYLSYLAYLVNPQWMAWAEKALPLWLRWVGVLTSLAMLPMLYWVMTSIGKNVSETVLTKEEHELVTHGPYRWIRHPLYTTATVGLVSLGAVAANWFMLAMAVTAFAAIALFAVPKEEAELVRKFGDGYRAYQERTGRFFPRLGR